MSQSAQYYACVIAQVLYSVVGDVERGAVLSQHFVHYSGVLPEALQCDVFTTTSTLTL